MGKYRKSDQYYIDLYDRMTIDSLKEKEAILQKAEHDLDQREKTENLSKTIALAITFSESGVQAAKNKRPTIQHWIEQDERKDRLVEKHPIPPAPYCKLCKANMKFFDYDFINDDYDLNFIFSCGKGTMHNQILLSNGQPYQAPTRYCPYCNGEINTDVKKTKYKITCKESCTKCTWSDVIVFDLPKPADRKIQPINEDDRKKYCTDFIGRRDFIEDLKAITSLTPDEDITYNLKDIDKINLPEVEERLTKVIESKGFIKLRFDQPKISGNVIIKFSVQDPTDRSAEKSIKTLKKTISDELFPTNWRLMTTGINYRLGYLDGQVKGVDLREDLIKLAMEIKEKK